MIGLHLNGCESFPKATLGFGWNLWRPTGSDSGTKPTQHPLDIYDSYQLDEKACTPEQRGIL